MIYPLDETLPVPCRALPDLTHGAACPTRSIRDASKSLVRDVTPKRRTPQAQAASIATPLRQGAAGRPTARPKTFRTPVEPRQQQGDAQGVQWRWRCAHMMPSPRRLPAPPPHPSVAIAATASAALARGSIARSSAAPSPSARSPCEGWSTMRLRRAREKDCSTVGEGGCAWG